MLRVVFGFALVGIAVWVLSSKTSELTGFGTIFHTFDWYWAVPALAAEIGSYMCFAAMQYELLGAGHLRAPWSPGAAGQASGQAAPGTSNCGLVANPDPGAGYLRRDRASGPSRKKGRVAEKGIGISV